MGDGGDGGTGGLWLAGRGHTGHIKKYLEFQYEGKRQSHFGYYDMDNNLWDSEEGMVPRDVAYFIKVIRETDDRQEWENWERGLRERSK
jgi:hypothetical protein